MEDKEIMRCNAQYVGNTMCGFINSHDYSLQITKTFHGYVIQGITDLTDQKGCSGYITLASFISVQRNFLIDEIKQEDK